MPIKIIIPALVLSLSACSTLLGIERYIKSRDKDSIVLEYNPTTDSFHKLSQTATEHCRQYNKTAVFKRQSEGDFQGMLEVFFACE